MSLRVFPCSAAIYDRCARPVRPGWYQVASRSVPTQLEGFFNSRKSTPSNCARPEVGISRPVHMRMVVDLPEPFGPKKPVTWPSGTVKLRSSTAVSVPYFLVRFETVSMPFSVLCDLGVAHRPQS